MYWPTRSSRVTATRWPCADVAEAVQDVGHPQRDRRLAGAGIAGEAHVQRRRLGGRPMVAAHAFDEEQRRDLADALLDRREADQLAVELVEHFGDAGLRIPPQIDGLRGFDWLLHGLCHVNPRSVGSPSPTRLQGGSPLPAGGEGIRWTYGTAVALAFGLVVGIGSRWCSGSAGRDPPGASTRNRARSSDG